MTDVIFQRAVHHRARFTRITRDKYRHNTPRATMTTTQGTDDVPLTTKPFNDLPGPKGWPIIGTSYDYLRKENQGQMHEIMRKRHREIGTLFREQFGTRHNLIVADPDIVEEIFRKEGKYPSRPIYDASLLYNEMRGRTGGLLTKEEEVWRITRTAFATQLGLNAMNDNMERINDVISDMVKRIVYLKTEHGQEQMVPNLLEELGKLTAESMLYIIVNKRVGCLEKSNPLKLVEFIEAIATMFQTGHELMVFARAHKLLGTRTWKKHVESWDTIYQFSEEQIEPRLEEAVRELEMEGPPKEGERTDFLKHALCHLSRKETLETVIEILMAGVDTTANALAFLLYFLSKDQLVQEKLVTEIDSVVGKKRTAESADLDNMPYLKACVKETLRLYPPIPINARVATQTMSLGGYDVPKNTIIIMNVYVMARDPKMFPEPDVFNPDRWLRDDEKTSAAHPFAVLPFGVGARACIGRRLAEMEMYLTVIQLLQNFKLRKSESFDISTSFRTQITPGPELPIMFLDRDIKTNDALVNS